MLKICLILAIALFSIAEGSVAAQIAKIGEKVEVYFGDGVKAIKREVPAGIQIWNFSGEHAGHFVDENGKKLEIDSSNYETSPAGKFVIKKFGEADVGSYEKEPNPMITTNHADGSISGVAGPVLQIYTEK